MNAQQLADTYQMAVPNLNSVSSIVLSLLGTAFTIFMVSKIFAAYAKKDWGALVMEACAGAVVAFFVFAPSTATAVLTSLGVGVFGS